MHSSLARRGSFIVFEGPNHSGKSTLLAQVADRMVGDGAEVVRTREPGGTPLGEGLRAVLKNPEMKGGAFASALAFNAARKEHVDRVIAPATERGAVVLCDRYFPSTEVFQLRMSGALAPAERAALEALHRTFPVPDLTIFIIPEIEVLLRRARARRDGADTFEGNPAGERLAYDEYAREFSRLHATLILRPALADEGRSLAADILQHAAFAEAVISGVCASR